MTRITLELGGHAPVLIFDDCDLEKTLDMVVPQKFRNAGQVCVSPTRFYVQSGIYDAFVKGFAERTHKVKVGDGLEAETKMGPLANARRPEAVGALIEDARAKGARVLAGGEPGEGGFFFQPTLLADVPNEAEIMNEEPFGPVAVSRPFDTFDEAIARGQPPAVRTGRLRLHRERPPRQSDRRRDRKRHGRHQHLRHLGPRRPVRRGQGLRLRQRRRQGRARDLPGGQGDPPGVSAASLSPLLAQRLIAVPFLGARRLVPVLSANGRAARLPPGILSRNATTALMMGCFGAQAILAGLFAFFSRFTRTTFLVYGIALLPFFWFNYWFVFVVPMFSPWMAARLHRQRRHAGPVRHRLSGEQHERAAGVT